MENKNKVKSKANNIDRYVGKNLRALRMISGFSQEEMGNIVDVSFQQIQKYEKGVNRISASRMYEFAQALGVKPNDFYKGISSVEISVQDNENIMHSLDKRSINMLRLFNSIDDPDVKDSLISFMKNCLVEK